MTVPGTPEEGARNLPAAADESQVEPLIESPTADQDARVRRAELLISTVLRTGVLTSLAVILLGTVLTFVHHRSYLSTTTDLARLTQPGAAIPHTLREVALGLESLSGQAIITLGLLLLILTPVVRVGVSILAFVAQRDWIYVAITATVLLLLLFSIVLGIAGG
ncbi:MAG: DUF1634 domain-containing protein [Gemmatimonadota bacterium]